MNKKTTKKIPQIKRLKTGIKGFDEVVGGGLPIGRSLLIAGEAGAGKSVFLSEFLYKGITKYGQGGVFVTFEERPDDIIKNVAGFGWDFEELIKNNKLAIVDMSYMNLKVLDEEGGYSLEPILIRIKYAIKKVKAKRVAIDSIVRLFDRFGNQDKVREILFKLSEEIEKNNMTVIFSSEASRSKSRLTKYGIEEYTLDGFIQLESKFFATGARRFLAVRKLRGANYRSGKVEYTIDKNGLTIFPKIPINKNVFKIDLNKRLKFGLPILDKILGGGVPQGHIILLGGNTGTGKTTLGMHFLAEGIKQGENTLWIGLEESKTQTFKAAKKYGWDFNAANKKGELIFLGSDLIDMMVDKLLYNIIETVEKNNIKRVVFDSISSMLSATVDKNGVRRFMISLSGFFKTKGITCVANYLTAESFGAVGGQLLSDLSSNEMRLSSIVDGIIILRYVERNQKVEKLCNVLKLRGSEHDKSIFKYDITKKGLVLGEKFKQ